MRDYAGIETTLLYDLGLSGSKKDWGSQDFTSDMSSSYAARLALAGCFYKKLCPTGNSPAAERAALLKFEQINARLPVDPYDFSAQSEVESCFWDYFVDHFNTVVGPSESLLNYDMGFIREHMNVGPGRAQKADSTYNVSKLFESEMSYTDPYLVSLYRGALVETGFWADAEMRRFQRSGLTQVRGGKLFFAPKNAEISRTCCTEANLNMIVQKSVGAFLEYRLEKCFGISLATQPDNNRRLARQGSFDSSFGTIDLVSASDSIGLQLLKRVMRDGFLKAVMLHSRSETAVLPDGRDVELRMISTMGNGYTFPLQTVIFACATRAVYDLMGFPSRCPRTQFGVFGDDIVVRRETYLFLCQMLNKLGFQVNVGKSFNTGAFRESCGHDYFHGRNIRGVYVRSLETRQQVYSLINRLMRWSTFHGIELKHTLKLLKAMVPDLRVPPSESDDAGVHVPFCETKPRLTDSYWFKYRKEKKVVRRVFVEEPDSEHAINPDGLAVGFLSGSIRRRDNVDNQSDPSFFHKSKLSVSLRDEIGQRSRYRIVTSSLPWWDFLTDSKQSERITLVDDEWRVPLTRDRYAAWTSRVSAYLSE